MLALKTSGCGATNCVIRSHNGAVYCRFASDRSNRAAVLSAGCATGFPKLPDVGVSAYQVTIPGQGIPSQPAEGGFYGDPRGATGSRALNHLMRGFKFMNNMGERVRVPSITASTCTGGPLFWARSSESPLAIGPIYYQSPLRAHQQDRNCHSAWRTVEWAGCSRLDVMQLGELSNNGGWLVAEASLASRLSPVDRCRPADSAGHVSQPARPAERSARRTTVSGQPAERGQAGRSSCQQAGGRSCRSLAALRRPRLSSSQHASGLRTQPSSGRSADQIADARRLPTRCRLTWRPCLQLSSCRAHCATSIATGRQ